MTSQEFIGVIKSEAECHLRCPVHSTSLAFGSKGRRGRGQGGQGKPSLLKCITDEVTQKVKDMGVIDADNKHESDKPFCK